MAGGKTHELGLAVGRDGLTVLVLGGRAGASSTVPLTLPPEPADPTEALEGAMRESASRLGISLAGSHAAAALLPPLSDVRMVALPPLRRAEADAVIRRDAARYFLGGTASRVIGIGERSGGGKGSSGSGQVLAAAASTALVEGVRRAAARCGITLDSVVPAHAAWMKGTVTRGAGASCVVAVVGDTAHVVTRPGEAAATIRRIPVRATEDVVGACGAGPGVVSLYCMPELRAGLGRALEGAGWSVVTDPERGPSAEEVAARESPRTEPELVPPSLAQERRQVGRRLAGRMVALAAGVVVIAAGIQLWGAQRALSQVRAERAEIAERVAPLVEAQDSLNRLNDRIATITSLIDQSPRWTRALVDLALHLPSDSYLTSLNASGDMVEIEAAGDRAGEAVEALRSATNLKDVRILRFVERELEDGRTIVERFSLSAQLTSPHGAGKATAGQSGPTTLEEALRGRSGGGQ